MSGRFAPSPTGRLHIGNLRTAAIGWLAARSSQRAHLVRMEDLDRVNSSPEHEEQQLADLSALGIDWDGEIFRQSERFDRYHAAINYLVERGDTYECFCTRREVRREIDDAPRAPHLPADAYPGTCRELTIVERRRHRNSGRVPAIRLRAGSGTEPGAVDEIELVDQVAGRFAAVVDDVVLRRNDGVPSYNVAVVVDDAAQGITQVVRARDLLPSTPRQIHLQQLLGFPTPKYAHVPLVVGPDGGRLAKRHGAVTLGDLDALGHLPADVVRWVAQSIDVSTDPHDAVASVSDLLEWFDLGSLSALGPDPIVFDGQLRQP